MPYEISDREIQAELRCLEEFSDEHVSIVMMKRVNEARRSLELGNEDFIADVKYWDGEGGSKTNAFVPIKPWNRANLGFFIDGQSIEELIGTINHLVRENKENADFIYFRCFSPDMESPTRCKVDHDRRWFCRLKAQYSTGHPRREYIDI